MTEQLKIVYHPLASDTLVDCRGHQRINLGR